MSDASGGSPAPESRDVGKKRSWFARHKILTAVGIVLLLGFLGNASKQRGHDASRGGEGTGRSASPAQPEIVISAIELSRAYKENEVRANQTYKGKLAEIQGEVHGVDTAFGRTFVTLKGGPWAPGIICAFHDKSLDARIAGFDRGTVVTMIGTIHGKTFGVDVKKCTLR